MIHGYPFTDYHELSLDYLMRLARESLGLHLETSGKFLKLVNANGDDISKLLVTYADMARVDDEGNTISAFIFNAGVDGNTVVFTKGNGEVTTITVPYSVKAEKDMNNNAITSYVHDVDVNGDNLIVTFGDNTSSVITVPFATKARDDVNGKAITSYTATVVPVGDKLAIKDGNNNTIAEITVPYSVKASNDEDNDNIKITYGHSLSTGATTVKLLDKTGTMLNEITIPYAVQALTDTDGNALLSDYGYHLAVNGRKIAIDAHNGATLNEITVPFATLSSNAENGIESVDISGDTIVFTTYAGQTFSITSPYSVKALKDSLNNTFISSYISQVTNDNNTGKISFFSPDGTKLAEITPTVNKAVNDSFNNRIADYIKTIATNPNSDYMTVTHGTGETDSITIHYATRAWKDTYDNVIGNTYIKNLQIELDSLDGKYYLIAYNGEDSELFRIALEDFVPSSLNDLSNVNITNPTESQIIIYDSLNDEWVNGDLLPVVIEFEETNNTITSVTLWGNSEQLSYQEVDSLVKQGHPIYCNNQGTPLYIISDYVTIANNSFVQFARDVNNGQGRITHRVFYSMNLTTLTFTKDSVEVGSIRPNLLITDTPSGNMQPNSHELHYVNVTVTRTTDVEPIIFECGPTSVDWNTAIPVYNAFIRNLTSNSFQIVYSTANLTDTTQAYGSSVRIKILC